MKIEIWSDIMCPFCFIGKKHFEKALTQLSFKKEIEIEWKSYQLDPTLPETAPGITEREYLIKRKGMPEDQIDQMFAHIKNMGSDAGVDFQFDKVVPVNSFKSHRLLHLTKSKGLQNEMEEALFEAHFTNGEDLSDHAVLTKIAVQIGLTQSEIENLWTSDLYTDDVKEDIDEGQNLGITGVPFFVIDRKYGISGAQPVQAFVDTIQKAYKESLPKIQIIQPDDEIGSPSCGPDGCEI